MPDLPIFEIKERLLAAVAKQRRLVITAPTGSGKSTQVPQMLFRDDSQVVILQPRRLPTRLLAAWVAQQRGVKLGEEVGYQIRFDDVTSPRTRIRYVTEGVLLRQMRFRPDAARIGTLIFDEFHERHLYGDITLARALQIQETARPTCSSSSCRPRSTCDGWRNTSTPCTVLSSEGRTFPSASNTSASQPVTLPVWSWLRTRSNNSPGNTTATPWCSNAGWLRD